MRFMVNQYSFRKIHSLSPQAALNDNRAINKSALTVNTAVQLCVDMRRICKSLSALSDGEPVNQGLSEIIHCSMTHFLIKDPSDSVRPHFSRRKSQLKCKL